MLLNCFEPYGQKLNSEDISEIEEAIGHNLPKDYVDFLLVNGGGEFIADAVLEFGGEQHDILTIYGKDGNLDLSSSGRDIRLGDERDGFPKTSLIIGRDIFGNQYFLAFSAGGGHIRWMDHASLSHIHVANSFSQFLNMLEIAPLD